MRNMQALSVMNKLPMMVRVEIIILFGATIFAIVGGLSLLWPGTILDMMWKLNPTAALLDVLQIPTADVIGISGSGPTALALALRHPSRIRKLIMESTVTTVWDEDKKVKRMARLLFGRAERVTWGLVKLVLRLVPMTMMQIMLQAMTTLDVHEVIQRMGPDDLRFVHRLLATSQSGTGFMNDLEHRVDDLSGIATPVLVMYSLYDKSVPPKNAKRVAAEVAPCELYEVPADTHLIWIGRSANDVWQKRLSFLQS